MSAKTPVIQKYIDPLTDFGFKRLFGSEPNKDLLIDLLNSIFNGRKHIVSLEYNKNEHPAEIKAEGSAIFDLTCTGEDGERFIIEVQRGRQANFKKRAIYYTSLLAAGQAPKGNRAAWAYDLPEIYFIALLEDFSVESVSDGQYKRDICLVNRDTGKLFYEGLGYIFLELVNFAKKEEELEDDLDKWLYVLKNICLMDKMPVFMRKTIFEKVFSIAEYTNMTKEEKNMYNAALKRKWDAQNVLDYAVNTAKQEGKIEGKIEERAKAEAEKRISALALRKMGLPVPDIAKALGLSEDEVK
ncbi:MAG: PD-(D/E)XK nuclease family transposase [Taibaiella sp.]|nr:PD-(D/E)XK nuclease family transposase [Taibaiella sp.]